MSKNLIDPIVAIATAPGRGGIGVVRISGPDLGPFIFSLLGKKLTPRHAHYLNFPDHNQHPIDQGLAIFFNQPHSYTGEDVLELQGHGGPAVLQQLLKRCLEVGHTFGLRLATPGEFTQRAFLNDKIDLAQAEAVADLIDATSEAAARAAVSSLSGEFSRRINTLSTSIVQLRMLIEATLDFPEEEIEFLEKYQARQKLDVMLDDIDNIISQSRQGMVLREGLHVVLAGEPNVGKSSLLNALAGQDLAIVTDIAGTTRDKVSQVIHLQGVPITIIDTAGLRETTDTIESIGISRSWAEIARADVVLHLMDATIPSTHLDEKIETTRSRQSIVLQVFNKQDLLSDLSNIADQAIYISAKTGKGLDVLQTRLLNIAGWNPGQESPWLARQRHIDSLEQSRMHLLLAKEHAAENDRVLDLFAEELRLAHDSLGQITGKMTPDDLLGEIFSNFCIGK
ncbi:MAG: tRNA uridine-5-carboxymethylaminomethyl(34) synthesis GTPase MnmE [Sheuella sp.]|nr:tRNA uridine-5-carboxymethylaminomethyl(34) synthesis GTPase MnmE [Sheuella sp.]